MLSPDRVPDPTPLTRAAADYDIVRRAIAYISRALARAAGDRGDRRRRRRHHHRTAPPVPPLGRPDAEGVPAGDHARPRAHAAARFRERARRHLRGRAVGTRAGCTTCSSPTRRCRRANGRPAAKASPSLWLPSLAVRHRAGDGDAARPRRPRVCRCRRGEGGARRHAAAAGRRRAMSRTSARTAPLAQRIFDPTRGGRTSRCASS